LYFFVILRYLVISAEVQMPTFMQMSIDRSTTGWSVMSRSAEILCLLLLYDYRG